MSVPANSSRVSKRLRFEILRRDNHTCRYCGGAAPDVKLTVDHVVPSALGGSNDPSNLVAACADCNSGKSATPADAAVVEDVAQDALRWSRAQALAAQWMAADQDIHEEWCQSFCDEWLGWGYGQGEGRKHFPLPRGWEQSLLHMREAGINPHDWSEAIDVAMLKSGLLPEDRWRYFCGVVWNKLKKQQELARDLMDRGLV